MTFLPVCISLDPLLVLKDISPPIWGLLIWYDLISTTYFCKDPVSKITFWDSMWTIIFWGHLQLTMYVLSLLLTVAIHGKSYHNTSNFPMRIELYLRFSFDHIFTIVIYTIICILIISLYTENNYVEYKHKIMLLVPFKGHYYSDFIHCT